MFACLYVPDFLVQAALLAETPDTRAILRRSPLVVLDGPASLLKVIALNDPARSLGIGIGMTKLQVETCGRVLQRKHSAEVEGSAQTELLECANVFSPTVESTGPGTVIFDLTGTEKLFGSLESTAQMISASAREHGFDVHVAIAANPDTVLYAAQGFAAVTVVPKGQEAKRLASLNISLLPVTAEMLETLESWGIQTFQALAALPEIPLTERLGQNGLTLQRLARGQTPRSLVPIGETPSFIERYEFDDPVETLESIAFVLNRLLQQVCARLISHSLATNELRLTLDLEVRRQGGDNGERYEHEWKLPVPTQDRKLLFSLVQLDLERQAFIAPIKKITVQAIPMKPRMAQGNLFAPPSPETERLEITLARIRGVVGDHDADGRSCVGSPKLLDTHKLDSFNVQPFSNIADAGSSITPLTPIIALRVFRPALETSVELNRAAPQFVRFGMKYRRVLATSGPWCSSGNWWNNEWARQEWDVALKTTAGIGFYRIYRDRIKEQWFVQGIFD